MAKQEVRTSMAPAAIGPYSQAVRVGGTVYVSGQLPVNVDTGEFDASDAAGQTRRSLTNAKAVLAEAGLGLENVVKTTVFLQDMGDFAAMNEVYAEFFSQPNPARSTVQVAALPKGALVEIELVAAE